MLLYRLIRSLRREVCGGIIVTGRYPLALDKEIGLIIQEAWHSSDELFTWPSLRVAREKRKNHPNGELGMWTTLENAKGTATNYGKHLYRLELSPVARFEELPISVLVAWGKLELNTQEYAKIREYYVKEGIDVLVVSEDNGTFSQAIIMNLEVIEKCSEVK